jgi:putative FmdB family regulatory protein
MPLYDFECERCGEPFEAMTSAGTTAPCPACGAAETKRLFTPFSGPFTVGMRGYAAKQSNAQRATREEQRRERREARKNP